MYEKIIKSLPPPSPYILRGGGSCTLKDKCPQIQIQLNHSYCFGPAGLCEEHYAGCGFCIPTCSSRLLVAGTSFRGRMWARPFHQKFVVRNSSTHSKSLKTDSSASWPLGATMSNSDSYELARDCYSLKMACVTLGCHLLGQQHLCSIQLFTQNVCFYLAYCPKQPPRFRHDTC